MHRMMPRRIVVTNQRLRNHHKVRGIGLVENKKIWEVIQCGHGIERKGKNMKKWKGGT